MFKIVEDTFYTVNDIQTILTEAKQNGTSTNYNQIEYWNIVFAFDIETSNFNEVLSSDGITKRSIMYVWQLAINGRVIVGREWHEFLYCIDYIIKDLDLSPKKRVLLFVHNLSFEIQYIRKMFTWKKIFAIDTRKPIYALTDTGIEFRCSYILTNYSLAKLGEQLQKYKVSKMVGDLDYKQVRTPLTPLSDKEMQYCINDVLVVSAYIKECQEHEKYIWRIPMTCTGYCRRFVRYNCLYKGGSKTNKRQYEKYHALMQNMKIKDLDEYLQLKRAFQGGFTHAAPSYSGWTMENISSIDETSAYPYALLSEMYPMSSGRIVQIHSEDELRYYLKYYCCIFDCRFFDLKPRFKYESYISSSKCFEKIGEVVNNGRIYKADQIGTTVTNIDFEIIEKFYKFNRCDIYNFRIYEKGYLPKEIITSIIKLYQDKTTLKGVKGKEQEYLLSKGLLNSVYGMMVTDIVRDEIIYDNDTGWDTQYNKIRQDKKMSEDEKKKTINTLKNKQITKYNDSKKRFNYYAWGVFCTAYARRAVMSGILEFGEDYVYSDTDSIKCRHIEDHKQWIDKYNALCGKKLQAMCKYHNIDYDDLLPKTIKGVVKPLGVWDYEGTYDKFKTVGAKRYMVLEGKELSITVSGVNKKIAIPYLQEKYSIEDCFNTFEQGWKIPAEYTGKLTHYYIDQEYQGVVTDYRGVSYNYTALSGIYLEETEYEFSDMSDYINFLKGYFYTI